MVKCLRLFLLGTLAGLTTAWIPGLVPTHTRGLNMAAGNDEDDLLSKQPSDARREQEIIMEKMSLKGADRIAKMGIAERAKRAMLAEAVEDRIFELTDSLEDLVEEDGSVSMDNRERAVELATQTKSLQQQYDDLVNGKPSSVLTALDSMGGGSTEG